MAVAKANKQPVLVTVNRTWQLAFIAALVVSQLISIGAILWSTVHYGHYTSTGTWIFQILQWLYPLPFVAAGYFFTLKRVRGLVPRLFWAVFVATIGMVVYDSLQLVINMIMAHYELWPVIAADDHSLWSAFGITWVQMAAAFVLYCLALWLVSRERRRR